jgi:hypothetical protein
MTTTGRRNRVTFAVVARTQAIANGIRSLNCGTPAASPNALIAHKGTDHGSMLARNSSDYLNAAVLQWLRCAVLEQDPAANSLRIHLNKVLLA